VADPRPAREKRSSIWAHSRPAIDRETVFLTSPFSLWTEKPTKMGVSDGL